MPWVLPTLGIKPGYSDKLNNVHFQEALHKARSKKRGCALKFILAPLVILPMLTLVTGDGFFTGLLVGIGIAALFGIIFLGVMLTEKAKKPWEGEVVDKYVKTKRCNRHDEHNYQEEYHQYIVVVSPDGKKHKIHQVAGNSSHAYTYFHVGDRVRYLADEGLTFPYEKYDKTADDHVICCFCNSKVDINADTCPKCHNPLLK